MALDIDVLEQSFDLVAPRGDELMDRFYACLFALDPEVEKLFAKADMEEQKRKLLSTLVLLRTSLRNLEALVPTLQALGARHRDYGVEPRHYPLVGTALLEAMAMVGGERWQPAYTAAWSEAYAVVQSAMLAGAQSPVAG